VQRGNGRQRIFFTHGDCRRYVDMLAQACHDRRLRCLAWYLMPNHIHLVLVPANAAGLRSAMSSVHTRYAQRINAREGSSEHLVQDRFRSYPMDQAHLMTAVRYIESNPVKAGLAASAEEWRWSSARAHVRAVADPLTDVASIAPFIGNWPAYLAEGLESADKDEAIEAALQSWRPVGVDQA
jgi:putative transposase